MSFKTTIIKKAIDWTPTSLTLWVANKVLKGIAELSDLVLDLDARTVYVKLQLVGEAEGLEVAVDGFGIIEEDDSYKFFVEKVKSNRIWLDNVAAKITGKAWKIPAIPQLAPYMGLVAELLVLKNPNEAAQDQSAEVAAPVTEANETAAETTEAS